MTISYRAAWVPDNDPQRPWDDALDLALGWLLAEQEANGGSLTLVLNTLGDERDQPLATYFRGDQVVTTRTKRRPTPGPVLAFVPDAESLALAQRRAHGRSLCVVESSATPLSGWAAEVGALDLTTGAVTASASPDIAAELERLLWYGNNAWGDQFGKRMGRATVEKLVALGADRDAILGAAMAARKSSNAMKNLTKIVNEFLPEPDWRDLL